MFRPALLAMSLALATSCTTPMTRFLKRDCRPGAEAMSAEPAPSRPPWKIGETPTVDQRNFYETYLLREVVIRDLKHEKLTHHITEHCQ